VPGRPAVEAARAVEARDGGANEAGRHAVEASVIGSSFGEIVSPTSFN
jgi:hypothetical protein